MGDISKARWEYLKHMADRSLGRKLPSPPKIRWEKNKPRPEYTYRGARRNLRRKSKREANKFIKKERWALIMGVANG